MQPTLRQNGDRTERERKLTGVHPIIFMALYGIVFLFLASISLTFGWDGETDFLIAVVIAFFAISFGVVRATASYARRDPRWRMLHLPVLSYLRGRTATATGSIRGWHAAVQILAMPAALALGMLAIGLVWVLMR